ncbi:MAG TPA: tRNA pseudouridine(38-40) synthase TruA [Thermoanaerobaculia bacterium]|nr:tRNA pseudouridine(38-40) synthase TruA [Thermoanaerobaculia bacterium]
MTALSVLRATLEYDGGRYRGWQAQVNARTVQGELVAACRGVLGEDVRVNGAGRTDAGVHAFAQVASLHGAFDAPAAGLGKIRQALNDRLPPDIHVLGLARAARSFHARHDAGERVYRYRISRRRTAFGKRYVWWVKDRLDAAAMQAGADLLVGRHDFAGFCENAEGHDSTLVEVGFARVEAPPEAPDLLLFRIGASHFLWKMVRRLAGTLVEVGTGRLAPAALKEMLSSRGRSSAAFTAPPSGLFLESVTYPGDPPPPPIDPFRPGF